MPVPRTLPPHVQGRTVRRIVRDGQQWRVTHGWAHGVRLTFLTPVTPARPEPSLSRLLADMRRETGAEPHHAH